MDIGGGLRRGSINNVGEGVGRNEYKNPEASNKSGERSAVGTWLALVLVALSLVYTLQVEWPPKLGSQPSTERRPLAAFI